MDDHVERKSMQTGNGNNEFSWSGLKDDISTKRFSRLLQSLTVDGRNECRYKLVLALRIVGGVHGCKWS